MKRRTAAGALILLGLLATQVKAAQEADGSAAERFPPGSIASESQASQALEAVLAERSEVQARFAQEESACYERFFVNRCIDDARERRRRALEPLDAIELEAERFQRLQRARARDLDVAERQRQAEEKAAQAAATEPRSPPVKSPSPPPAPSSSPRKPPSVPTPEQERAAAAERAENEAAYARKVQASKERQDAVARRKAEKEQRRAQRSGNEGAQQTQEAR